MLTPKEQSKVKPTLALVDALRNLQRQDILDFILSGLLTSSVKMDLENSVYFLGLVWNDRPTPAYREAAVRVETQVPGFINFSLCKRPHSHVFDRFSFQIIEAGIAADRKTADAAWDFGKREKSSSYHRDAAVAQEKLNNTKANLNQSQLDQLEQFFSAGQLHKTAQFQGVLK